MKNAMTLMTWFWLGMLALVPIACSDDDDDKDTETDTEEDTESDTETETEDDTETETEDDTESETEPDTGLDTETAEDTETGSDIFDDTDSDFDLDGGVDTETETDTATDPDAGIDTDTQTDDGGTDTDDTPLDPGVAPRVPIDRFSASAGTLFVRDESGDLPEANEPIDFDRTPFIVRALAPDGRPLSHYNFDVMPQAPAPIYVLIREGEAEPVADQLNIIDVIPGDIGYNDFWQIMEVTVPEDYVANTITSAREILASGYDIEETDQLVNCPIVPEGSTATLRADDAETGLTRGWYEDQVVFYFNFSEGELSATAADTVPVSSAYVAFNINPTNPGGGPESGFMTEPDSIQTHNVRSTIPEDDDYSPLLELSVYDNAEFDMVTDLESAMDATIIATLAAGTINAPVVTVNADVTAAISASDQTMELSTVLEISEVSSPGPGWVVIHEEDEGNPGDVIGYQAVLPGTHSDLMIPLNRPAEDGEILYAMLHDDLGVIGEYEFPGPDMPVMDGGNPVTATITVSVPDSTPAIRVTIDNAGDTDYYFVSVEPPIYQFEVAGGRTDPVIILYYDWRYEFVNQSSDEHPFELIAAGATPEDDEVGLSQATDGTLEEDEGIDWFDEDGTIRFTVTVELLDLVDAYRCATHPVEMRGGIFFN